MAGGHGDHAASFPEPKLPTEGKKWGYMNRVNRVPYYQAIFQRPDGRRQWEKTPKSSFLVRPFKITMYTTLAGTMYMMIRMVLGKKTWYGNP